MTHTAPATILIVDDLPVNRILIARYIERLGHHILEAGDGQEALQIVRAQPVDLILLDIMMPVLNGFETLAALKSDPALASIPVVVISALSDLESVARCIRLGAEDFLFKPVEQILLEARVVAGLARRRLHELELAARAAAEEASRAKGRFVALVSHELRSPLTALIGYADLLLRDQAIGPASREQLGTLSRLGRQIAMVLDDLGDLTRIEAGQLRIELERLALGAAVEDAANAVRGMAAARRHALHLEIAPGLPDVRADGVRLVQVLTNLLSNACKYTPDGGTIVLTAEARDPATVAVTVRDNGLGIAAAEQARIFEPFFRSAEEDVRLQPGTGLGLNITRYLVELQGGAICFTSTPGEGTAFTFTLPAAPAPPPTTHPATKTPEV